MKNLILVFLIPSLFCYSQIIETSDLATESSSIIQSKEGAKKFEDLDDNQKKLILDELNHLYQQKIIAEKQTQLNQVAALRPRITHAIQLLAEKSIDERKALNFYYDCYESLRYKNNSHGFYNWKEQTKDIYRDENTKRAVQLNMKWLILKLKARLSSDFIEDPNFKLEVESIMKHYTFYQKKLKKNVQLEISSTLAAYINSTYKIPLTNYSQFPRDMSSFSNWYRIQRIDPAIKDKNITNLEKYWDEYIALSQLAIDETSPSEVNKFNTLTRPDLVMKKANNLYQIGEDEAYIKLAFTLVSQYPNHPDYKNWLDSLIEIVDPEFKKNKL